MNESNLPFAIGQRVVCVDAAPKILVDLPVSSVLKKDNIYTVLDLQYGCCGWEVYIGLNNQSSVIMVCPKCGNRLHIHAGKRWFAASRFAPYDPPKLEIPAALLEVDLGDGIDVIKEKELV